MPQSKRAVSTGNLTVYDAAKLLNLSAPTIRRYVDGKQISNCYRIPGTRERRIPAPSLLAFLNANGMPIPNELTDLVKTYHDVHTNPLAKQSPKPAA